MLSTGLLSVTFRKLSVEEIIGLAVANGLNGIEWGGDIHAPPRDLAMVARVARLTKEADLRVCAYGSYFRLGSEKAEDPTFAEVLEAAATLGAPLIRVWVGTAGSADTTPEKRAAIIAQAKVIATQAQARGIIVASEWHGGTLTDTDASAQDFLAQVDHPNFKTLWQPPVGQADADATAGLKAILSRVVHVHVFSWLGTPANITRWPLAKREAAWRTWLALAAQAPMPVTAALEFMMNDDPAMLPGDAMLLNRIVTDVNAAAG